MIIFRLINACIFHIFFHLAYLPMCLCFKFNWIGASNIPVSISRGNAIRNALIFIIMLK